MTNVKVGDRLAIHCYKHNGTLEHISDEVIVLDNNEDVLICGNGKTKITEKDGRSHMTNEPAVLYFYKKRWFNVIGQLKKYGLFYYCNIATPFVVDENVVKYIDYDLDLRVFPDGGFRVLDRNEYKYHKKIMHYSDDLDLVIRNELSNLIASKRKNEDPFNKETIEKYYQIYQELQNK